jgi:hypothetical protein
MDVDCPSAACDILHHMNLIGTVLLAVVLLSGLVVAALTKRRPVRLASFAIVAIVIAVAGFFLWQASHWGRGFDQIHVGDDRDRVGQIMGRPTADTDATIGIYGSQRLVTNRVPGCVEQYWYYPFFTPECWWIALDAQGRVLKTYHYISP